MAEAKADKKVCGLCGKTKKLIKTECCNNWICDDEHKYVTMSFARNSCHRNHRRYTLCGVHHSEKHEGKWQDCDQCKTDTNPIDYWDDGTNEYNFEKLRNPPKLTITCNACGFTAGAKKYFPTRVGICPNGFYCAKKECHQKALILVYGEKYKDLGKVKETNHQAYVTIFPMNQPCLGFIGDMKEFTSMFGKNNKGTSVSSGNVERVLTHMDEIIIASSSIAERDAILKQVLDTAKSSHSEFKDMCKTTPAQIGQRDLTLTEKIKIWATTNKIKLDAASELIKLLKESRPECF